MYLKSKKTSLIILGITAIIFSKVFFILVSLNDPEGSNLLIVVVLAMIIYFLSLLVFLFNLSSIKKLLLAIIIQTIIVISLYFCLS